MLGISYGELLLLIGATAACIGPKDLPVIARMAGRMAGRAIGYVQLARGQFDSVMQQTQARQVHKELQDTLAQIDAIRHEIRSISILNPGPLTQRLVDNPELKAADSGVTSDSAKEKPTVKITPVTEKTAPAASILKVATSEISNEHRRATMFARMAGSATIKNGSSASLPITTDMENQNDESGLPTVLPVSAENTGLLPKRPEEFKGSDIMLEAVLEAEVARSAKEFFSHHASQTKQEEG
ncbi:sec-independent protein translocase protein TatB [Benincasa hispida]|uniref:sec-independent protein translocase protein TatB n=1 Tax=Benincasa hispida TaxID=102211 RepID=UPI001901F104|nr:sec-independent protein translocase protein TatB [Benincasa hispida]